MCRHSSRCGLAVLQYDDGTSVKCCMSSSHVVLKRAHMSEEARERAVTATVAVAKEGPAREVAAAALGLGGNTNNRHCLRMG